MSDFTPDAPVDSEATGDAAPAENVDWKAVYENEKQERIKERERYKPIAQTFQNLHPEDARAIQDFVRAYANGDTETATRWMIDNARTLAGDRFDTFLSPQQEAAITQQAQVDGVAAGLTPQQVEQMVEQRLQQYQMTQIQQQYETEIEQTLIQHGYEPDSPLATAAVLAASKRPDLNLAAAIQEIEDQLLIQAQTVANRRAEAAQSMGSPVINGVAAVGQNGQAMSPRERALARLEANGI